MKYHHAIAALNLISVGMALGLADTALAQTAPEPSGLSEIIVTATRRETNVQDTPLAITAISGDSLRNKGITDPRQLSGLAPNLNVDQGLGNGSTHVSIRGQASTSFAPDAISPAGVYLDDVYQPYQVGIGTQIFDLNRIEVLRGPQGTLFGRNTTAGSLAYYSEAPQSNDSGYMTFDGGGGDFRHYAVEGAFNKKLTDTLAGRASFRVDRRDAFVDNLSGGGKLGEYTNYAGRIQLGWKPGVDTKINLKVFGLKNTGDAPVYIARGYFSNPCAAGLGPYFNCVNGVPTALSPNSRTVYSERPTYENYDNYGATLKIDQNIGEYSLTSISNIQKGSYRLKTNDDGMAGDFFHSKQSTETWQTSQELRLATPVAEPLRAIFGVYGQYDSIHVNQSSISSDLNPALDPTALFFEYGQAFRNATKSTTFAGFTSVTYDIAPAFSVTGGLRYSYERKNTDQIAYYTNDPNKGADGRDITEVFIDLDYAVTQNNPAVDTLALLDRKKSWKKLTWDVTANFKPSEESLLYAKVSTGFRSGGFFTAPRGQADRFVALNPETVTSYEVGFKTQWLDNRLRLNGSGYYSDYKNMQIQIANQTGAGTGFSNGAGRIKGVELELELAPVTGLLLSGSVGYNEAKYVRYDTFVAGVPVSLKGNNFPYAPKWSGNVAASYTTAVSSDYQVSFNTNWNYRSEIFYGPENASVAGDKDRFIGNAQIGFGAESGDWELSLYANNLLNVDARAFTYSLGFIAPTVYAPKRTWGVRGNFRF